MNEEFLEALTSALQRLKEGLQETNPGLDLSLVDDALYEIGEAFQQEAAINGHGTG